MRIVYDNIVLLTLINTEFFFIVFFLILITYMFYSYEIKCKYVLLKRIKELHGLINLLTKSNKEKEILLKEIHHRIKNNLQLVMSLLTIQANNKQSNSIEEFIEMGQSRILSMALIHQNLYLTENFLHIDFDNYLSNLIENIKKSYDSKNVRFIIETNQNQFDIDTAIPLGLIINELVYNALKYAFPEKTQAEIVIQINKIATERFQLIVSDNGVGYHETQIFKQSIGLELVELLVQQLEGTIEKKMMLGTQYQIEFKSESHK
jgi:two-component system, sensor histidine kinase PdtaS